MVFAFTFSSSNEFQKKLRNSNSMCLYTLVSLQEKSSSHQDPDRDDPAFKTDQSLAEEDTMPPPPFPFFTQPPFPPISPAKTYAKKTASRRKKSPKLPRSHWISDEKEVFELSVASGSTLQEIENIFSHLDKSFSSIYSHFTFSLVESNLRSRLETSFWRSSKIFNRSKKTHPQNGHNPPNKNLMVLLFSLAKERAPSLLILEEIVKV